MSQQQHPTHQQHAAPAHLQQSQRPHYAPQPQQFAAPQVHAPQQLRTSATTMASTNAFAVVSIILVFIQPIAGIIFGHIALSQIKRSGDSGRGLALTGVIIGYIVAALLAIFVVLYVTLIFAVFASAVGSIRA